MDPVHFVDGIASENVDTADKTRVVQALRTFYCRHFAEDGIEGTSFDCQVLDALDLILLYPELWELKRDILAGVRNSAHDSRVRGNVCPTSE